MSYRGMFYVLLSAILFGSMPLQAQALYALGMNPVSLTFQRFLFSWPVLFYFAWRRDPELWRLEKQELPALISLAFCFSVTPALLFSSYQYIPSGLATVLHFVYPLFVLLILALFYKQRPGRRELLAMLLCLAGIACFANPSNFSSLGLGLALLSGLTYALYIVWLRHSRIRHYSSLKLSTFVCALALLLFAGYGSVRHELIWHLPLQAWGLSALFAITISVVAVLLFQEGAKQVGSQQAALLSTLEPVTALIFGATFLHENLTRSAFIGITLILLAIFNLALPSKAPTPNSSKRSSADPIPNRVPKS